ncbi:GAF domain-containing protein [Speluncibacter jeojiensis]|uniref:DUF5593 domain-containing protein n=1 Tax=Speluncibacter jeojiensis TaxID=2710754 RepID=A0A9X4RD00_9ACTN|nr:DUF5593 domain-containing protein [Corynebacteriales bacterium D3-21]
MGEWSVVETLVPEGASLIFRGSTCREWTSPDRLSPAADVRVGPLIETVRRTGEALSVTRRSERGKHPTFRIDAHPVLGPSGEPHGVQVWVGAPDEEPTPPRITSGVSWLLHRQVIAQTVEACLMSGVQPDDCLPERTPAEYFAKSVRFDDEMGLLGLALDPVDGGKWLGEFSVLHADGRIMLWQCAARARVDPGREGIQVLWHDISDVKAPALPSLSVLGLRETLAGTGFHAGLFALDLPMLSMWVSDPPPWVQWRDLPQGARDILHPDDRRVLTTAHERFLREAPAEIGTEARLRGQRGTWVRTLLRITPYPGDMGKRLAVVRMTLPH